MFNILTILFLTFLISMIVMKVSILFSNKLKFNKKKNNSFECGFDLISNARMFFSLRFFFITILFLIFDVELTLLIPMIKTFNNSILLNWMWTSIILIFILLLGIYYEWKKGALEWMQ